jgi:hypothetical protein
VLGVSNLSLSTILMFNLELFCLCGIFAMFVILLHRNVNSVELHQQFFLIKNIYLNRMNVLDPLLLYLLMLNEDVKDRV